MKCFPQLYELCKASAFPMKLGGRGLNAREGTLCVLQTISPLSPSCAIYPESTVV